MVPDRATRPERRGDPRRQHALPRRGGRPLRRQVGHRLRRDRPRAGAGEGAQGARSTRPDGWRRSLEIGAGTGYFTLNLLRAGMIAEATCTDISPGMLTTLRANAERLGAGGAHRAGRRRAPAVRRRELRPRARPRGPAPHPRPRARVRGVRARARARAARSCSPASPRATATASRAFPSAPPARSRRCGAARSARRGRRSARRAAAPDAALEGFVDVHAFAPGELARAARSAGFADVRVTRRGAARQLVRLDQPHARGDRRARGRAVGLAPVRLPRLPDAAGRSTAALLESRLPPAIFYNLLIAARKPRAAS